MARDQKRRRGSPPFLRLFHDMTGHPNFLALSGRALKMLVDVASQYRGSNNGDLCATYSVMSKKGWRSNDQIQKAVTELVKAGFLIKTRQGRRPNVANLYAITWEAIDECGGKLEISATSAPLHTWKRPPPEKPKRAFSDGRSTVQATPPHGATGHEKVVPLHRLTALCEQKS